MRWMRSEPGRYVAGPYVVQRVVGSTWRATGPGLDPEVNWHGKDLAQDEAYRALVGRLSGNGRVAGPVYVGDVVEIIGQGRKGVVAAEFPGTHHPVFSILLPRGRRLCLERSEFALVSP